MSVVTWILILFVRGSGETVTVVPGFGSFVQCATAGEAAQLGAGRIYSRASYACVSTGTPTPNGHQ